MIAAALRLGVGSLTARWRLGVLMSLAAALPFMAYLLLEAYRAGLRHAYSDADPATLVVQSSGSMGEFYGSRLPLDLRQEIAARGAREIHAEIHTIVGGSPAEAVLLRGVALEDYLNYADFALVDGRPLQPDDPPRSAMIGVRLAEKRELAAGDVLLLRGRRFNVLGVIATGTYADYEAWVSLADAQALLGWETDVSTYLIPAGQGLQAGDALSGGASVVAKGTASADLIAAWEPLFDLLKILSAALGVAATITLGELLLRLAWQRRRELAILRGLGFPRATLALYLLAQSAAVAALGLGLGVFGALGVGRFNQLGTLGITITPLFDPATLLAGALLAGLLALSGALIPAWRLNRLDILKGE
ncbi:MAG: ABC transporter permease [Chloroflexi bacterium]|nr:ABC transporter permease [Chloroflexota bacterium]